MNNNKKLEWDSGKNQYFEENSLQIEHFEFRKHLKRYVTFVETA